VITIYNTKVLNANDVREDSTVIHGQVYSLLCKDTAGNEFEVETNKDTFVQVSNFLYKIKEV
jgi:hypothetical protein